MDSLPTGHGQTPEQWRRLDQIFSFLRSLDPPLEQRKREREEREKYERQQQ